MFDCPRKIWNSQWDLKMTRSKAKQQAHWKLATSSPIFRWLAEKWRCQVWYLRFGIVDVVDVGMLSKVPSVISWNFWIDPSISCWPRFWMFFARPIFCGSFVKPGCWEPLFGYLVIRMPMVFRLLAHPPMPWQSTPLGVPTVTPQRVCQRNFSKNRWSQTWSPSIEFLYRKCRWHRQVPTNWPRRKCPGVQGCRLWPLKNVMIPGEEITSQNFQRDPS